MCYSIIDNIASVIKTFNHYVLVIFESFPYTCTVCSIMMVSKVVKLGSCSHFSEKRSRAEAIISVYHPPTHHHQKLFKADRRQKITLCQLTLIMFMLRSINSGQFHQTHWSHGHHGHQVHRQPISVGTVVSEGS